MQYKRIGDIAELINGYAFKSKNYVDQGIRVIRIANVQDGKIVDEQPCFYSEKNGEDIEKYILKKGDLLISLTGNVGRVGLLSETMLPAALNQRVGCIRLKDANVDMKYLFFCLRRKEFIRDCIKASKGVAQLNLSTKWIEDYKVPIPELLEQRRIVSKIEELFSSLDNSVETLNKTKNQLEVYRHSVLKDAFEKYKEKKKIRDVSVVVTSGSRGWAKYYADEGARFIRITDLSRDGIALKNDSIKYVKLPDNAEGKRSRLKGNDVLVSITADLGSIALVPETIPEAYINQHIAMIRFINPVQGEFMSWYLKSDYGQKDLLKNKRGGGKLGLGLDDIRDTFVPIVEDEKAISTVKEIDARISACENIEKTIDTIKKQAEAMRQSILKEAFEGRLI